MYICFYDILTTRGVEVIGKLFDGLFKLKIILLELPVLIQRNKRNICSTDNQFCNNFLTNPLKN